MEKEFDQQRIRMGDKKKNGQARKVYGFLCTDGIRYGVRLLGKQLRVPDYCIAEHLIQLGAAQVTLILEEEKFRKELEDHLIREHLLEAETTDNEYDARAMKKARRQQLMHMERENQIRWLVDLVEHRGISTRQLVTVIKNLLSQAGETRRSN